MNSPKFLEFHIIQSFPSSCLNRDDNNSHKSIQIGGAKRARISSQCFKRAIREHARTLSPDLFSGVRTKSPITKDMLLNDGFSDELADYILAIHMKIMFADTLTYFMKHEHNATIELYRKYMDQLKELKIQKLNKNGNFSKAQKEAVIKSLKEYQTELNGIHKFSNGIDAVDIALFGRMLASSHENSVEGACYYADSISTHQASIEYDFFVGMDDNNTQGAGHLGTNELSAPVYYRYLCLDLNTLFTNLKDMPKDKILKAIEVFCYSIFEAVPSAKQHSNAAFSDWDYGIGLVRNGQPMQMSFEAPIKSTGEGFSKPSIDELNNQLEMKSKRIGRSWSEKGRVIYDENGNRDSFVDTLIELISNEFENE
jgi:CRISPR system Cascade subunit CasC